MARPKRCSGAVRQGERGLKWLRNACRLRTKELAALLRVSPKALAHAMEQNRSLDLKDDAANDYFPSFYLIKEFGVIPGSCQADTQVRYLAGFPFSAQIWKFWKVSDEGKHEYWCDQLAAKLLWTWEWFTFGGPAPDLANTARSRWLCDPWGINLASLDLRSTHPSHTLKRDLRVRLREYERVYGRLPLDDRRNARMKERERFCARVSGTRSLSELEEAEVTSADLEELEQLERKGAVTKEEIGIASKTKLGLFNLLQKAEQRSGDSSRVV